VAGQSWSELLPDYDLRHGRLWVLIPIGTALGPAAAHAARSRTRGISPTSLIREGPAKSGPVGSRPEGPGAARW
jgi:hypothetical protein